MIFSDEDQKIVVDQFKGIFNRGVPDEVPVDHAMDCQNVEFPSSAGFTTRSGCTKALTVPNTGIRRFFLFEQNPPDYNQPITNASGVLICDASGNIYVNNNASPLYSNGAINDICGINMGNRTYISPFNNSTGVKYGYIQIYNPMTGVLRQAAGLAPAQASSFLAAANSATAGSVPAGEHKIAVVFETDTGYWTQPGPKKQLSCTPAASTDDTQPTVFSCTAHGIVTGESHTIRNLTNPWAICNGTWIFTRVDDNHFSIPVDTFGYTSPPTGQVDAGFVAATVTADGTHKIDVSNIPTGPSGTIARIILATRATEQEFFFVPNVPGSLARIPNNTATTCTIDFFDTDLVDSADYLFDLLEAIPAGTAMCKYRGRLIIAGVAEPTNTERVLVSNINDQETFSNVSGYIQVQTENDGNVPKGLFVLRDTLYITKFTGVFSAEDNGGNPSTWAVEVVDAMVGAFAGGIGQFTSSQPAAADTGDLVILASKIGLFIFDGVMRRPELSYKIQAIWDRIPYAYFYRLQVVHDPWNHVIYIAVPLDAETDPSTVLVCDYTDGRDYKNVKWSVLKFPWVPSCIGMMNYGSAGYGLKMGSLNTVYLRQLDSSVDTDDGTTIVSYWKTGLFKMGGVVFWKMLNVRANGTGNLSLALGGEDESLTATPSVIALQTSSGREWQKQFNFVNEKMSVKLQSGSSSHDKMTITQLDVWGKLAWPLRPAI